jgi:hypothetical protein
VKRPLRDLDRGTLFRTADGLLWQPGYPVAAATRWCHAVGRPRDSTGLPADAEVEVVDPAAVLARAALLERENAELRAVLHDLWQDRDGAAAAAAERGAAAEVIRGEAGRWRDGYEGAAYGEGLRRALDLLKARGPWHPPAPPCALEAAVREAVEKLQEWHDARGPAWADIGRLLARLREALGEANG